MKRDFYVYIYLDPLIKGKFEYSSFSFLYRPLYVGKGHGKRDKYHLRCLTSIDKKRFLGKFYNRIKEIYKEGEYPFIIKLREGLFEEEAFSLEKFLILDIGRKDLGKGFLLNRSDGGEGDSGKVFTKEWRESLSLSAKNKVVTEETRKRMSLAWKGEKNHRFGLSIKGRLHSQETKNKLSLMKKLEGKWRGKNNPSVIDNSAIIKNNKNPKTKIQQQIGKIKKIHSFCREQGFLVTEESYELIRLKFFRYGFPSYKKSLFYLNSNYRSNDL